MNKLLKSLPSVKITTITVVVCLVLGVLTAGGFYPKAIPMGLVIAFTFLLLVTLRNWNPDAWEAYHEPLAYSLRVDRDDVVRQLQVLINACDSGDPATIADKTNQARQLLADIRRSAQ